VYLSPKGGKRKIEVHPEAGGENPTPTRKEKVAEKGSAIPYKGGGGMVDRNAQKVFNNGRLKIRTSPGT